MLVRQAHDQAQHQEQGTPTADMAEIQALIVASGAKKAGDLAGRAMASSLGNFRDQAPAARGSARGSGLVASSSDDFAVPIVWLNEVHGHNTHDVHKQLSVKYPDHLRRSAFARWPVVADGFPLVARSLGLREDLLRRPILLEAGRWHGRRWVAGAAR